MRTFAFRTRTVESSRCQQLTCRQGGIPTSRRRFPESSGHLLRNVASDAYSAVCRLGHCSACAHQRALINLEAMGTKVHEGAFFGKSVRLAPGMTLRHRPMPWLVQTVSVTPAQVCPGQSFEVAAQTGNVGLPNDSVKVLIDRVPVTRYVDQLFGNPGPREITVVAKASGGLIDSQVATVELVACPKQRTFPSARVRGEYPRAGLDPCQRPQRCRLRGRDPALYL